MKPGLSQNFLFDPSILKRIVAASGIGPEDTVVEIGPGLGTLTGELCRRAGKVVAIEVDRRLYERMKAREAGFRNLTVELGDALRFPYGDLGEFRVVANIPYHITTPIIFRLLEEKGLRSMTLTIQKEVAQRIAAGPGSKTYGVLSLMVQYRGRPELKFTIPRGAFRPVPKVDSACIHIDVHVRPPVAVRDEALLFRLVKAAFSQRRKTVANGIKSVCGEGTLEALRRAGIEAGRRPETLSLEEFARLADAAFPLL
ncbi:MAG: 16S rRNA (adenine(1518)-N(6)/adenine(1519)-N(6))-dimethyltransferase RsmA [Nitrospiraceae bacterium]|nr:16S rRNA (adenine(1518)-N(6)/adenine(1519)-N(6))-dimethyltransferase RsmA [Nitrospiraceae bacterium]